MRLQSRVVRLETKTAPEEARLVIVYEDEAGGWTTYKGEPVTRESLAANAQVIVFPRYDGGPL